MISSLVSLKLAQLKIVPKKTQIIYCNDALKAFDQFSIYENYRFNGRVAIYILHENNILFICNLALKYKNWLFYVHDKQNIFDSELVTMFPNLFFFRTPLKKWRTSKDCLLFTPPGPNGQLDGHFTLFFVKDLEDIKLIFNKIKILTIRIVQVETNTNCNSLFDKLLTDRFVGKKNNFKYWDVKRLSRISVQDKRKWLFKLDGLGIRQ